jgi:hypothetical protein
MDPHTGYPSMVKRRPSKLHIVTYTCEHCSADHTTEAGIRCNGMCVHCGFPMKIAQLFSDRRIVSVPVLRDRRAAGRDEPA